MAARYWVGATATWDATVGTKWAATSGSVGGASVPTAADDVFFDASSTGTCTLSASTVCRSLNCSGFTGTISHPASTTINVGDATAGASNVAFTAGSGMTYTVGAATTSIIQFISTSGTVQTVTSNGKVLPSLTFNGTGSWQFTDNITATAALITLTKGSLDTNNKTITAAGFISSASNTRSLTLGTSTVNVSVNGTGGWSITSSTGLTVSAATSTISINTSNNSANFGTGYAYGDVVVQYGNGSGPITGVSCTFVNLTLKGGNQARLFIASDFTVTGLLSIISSAGNNTNVPVCISDMAGVQRTFNVSSAPTLSNVTFQDIIMSGSGTPYATTQTGDGGNNSGMTLTAPRTLYFVNNGATVWANTSSWSLTSGGTSGQAPPLPQDTAIFDANSITTTGRTITIGWQGLPTIDFTNVLNSPTISVVNTNGFTIMFGDFIMKAGLSFGASTGSLNCIGRNNDQTLDFKGISYGGSISQSIGKAGGTIRLGSDYVSTGTITIGNGASAPCIFDANNFNVTCTTFNASNTSIRTLTMGTGTWTLTGTGTVWNIGTTTNLTFNANTSTIVVSDTSATAKTFTGGRLVYNNVTFTGGGNASFSLGAGNTYNNLTCSSGPTNFTVTAGERHSINGVLALTGSAANLVSWTSLTTGTPTIIRLNGSSNVTYASFKDVNANEAASIWAADGTCVDNGNNHNVIFKQPNRLATGGSG